ncbi:unnamed protein product, partial [Closterium sp. NIES-53]
EGLDLLDDWGQYGRSEKVTVKWGHLLTPCRASAAPFTSLCLTSLPCDHQEGLDLLDDWGQYGRSEKVTVKWGEIASRVLQKRKNWPADDQTALVLMLTGEGEKEEDRAKGLKPLADRWAPRTFLDPTNTLHGFWGLFVDKLEAIAAKYHNGVGDWEWPFTVHFTGCKLCDRKFSDYDPDTCDLGIHRSFAFADNQVLKRYGLQHANLNDSAITKIGAQAA